MVGSNKDGIESRSKFRCVSISSMVCIQEELGVLGSRVASARDGSLSTNERTLKDGMENMPPLDDSQEPAGWMDGLLGCLQPVWKIIGKATGNELKGHIQGEYQFFENRP